jgi:hypothetical protein
MIQYEEILSKIAPVFHKLIPYELYFESQKTFIDFYLVHAKFPRLWYVYLPLDIADQKYFSMQSIKNTIYDYYISTKALPIYESEVFIEEVTLNEKYKLKKLGYFASFSEFIVNLIINNFSFENEHILISDNFTKERLTSSGKTYKDLFILLVGKDTYETIRANIK